MLATALRYARVWMDLAQASLSRRDFATAAVDVGHARAWLDVATAIAAAEV